MPTFSFSFDRFTIANTRSRDTDTDYVSVSLAVGTQPVQTQGRAMGDLNNGTYNVGIVVLLVLTSS